MSEQWTISVAHTEKDIMRIWWRLIVAAELALFLKGNNRLEDCPNPGEYFSSKVNSLHHEIVISIKKTSQQINRFLKDKSGSRTKFPHDPERLSPPRSSGGGLDRGLS
jgi:hypothetical protein